MFYLSLKEEVTSSLFWVFCACGSSVVFPQELQKGAWLTSLTAEPWGSCPAGLQWLGCVHIRETSKRGYIVKDLSTGLPGGTGGTRQPAGSLGN